MKNTNPGAGFAVALGAINRAADGTPLPMIAISSLGTVFGLACAASLLVRPPPQPAQPVGARPVEVKNT